MIDEPFGRQPEPVEVIFKGDPRDVEHYIRKIQAFIERSSYANVVRENDHIRIYPRAVND